MSKPDPMDVLSRLMHNPSICLADQVYAVREEEGKGWDGPDVKAWAVAVKDAEALVGPWRKAEPPAPRPIAAGDVVTFDGTHNFTVKEVLPAPYADVGPIAVFVEGGFYRCSGVTRVESI